MMQAMPARTAAISGTNICFWCRASYCSRTSSNANDSTNSKSSAYARARTIIRACIRTRPSMGTPFYSQRLRPHQRHTQHERSLPHHS